LAQSLGRRIFFPVPKIVITAAMGEMSAIVLHSQQVKPVKLAELNYKFKYSTINEAMEEICQPLKNGHLELLQEQWVPHPPKEIFPFFCNEKNLERLTPPFLNFHVVGKSSEAMQEGTLIEYKLSLHGIPFRWKSVIEKWTPGTSFVDQQITGPYKRWHHTHEFIPMSQGTLMRDRVSYSLPFGRLGSLLTSWKVIKDVNNIFAYRRTVIRDLFD
jgi:ligand-binding SRPBCC domain-containing protein